MRRILLGVDDSPAGLAAARAAVALAVQCAAELRVIHVVDGPGRNGRGRGAAHHDAPVDPQSVSVLRFATGLADRAGVPVDASAPAGDPARRILDQAATWPADVIVVGRSAGRRVGQPYIGSKVQHVLEFSDIPVLVVPPPPERR